MIDKNKIRTLTDIVNGKAAKSTIFFVAFLIILSVYIFFFTSTLTIQNSSSKNSTPLNSAQGFDVARSFTITRWDYSKSQKLMEVEFDIENKNYDGNDEYIFKASSRSFISKNLETNVIMQDSSFAVVQILNVPDNFQDILLRVEIADENIEHEYLKLYTNLESVNKVDNIVAKEKSDYLKGRIQKQIENYHTNIEALKDTYEKIEKKIQILKDTNFKLESEKKYQTLEEINKTNSKIRENENQIKTYEQQITNNEKGQKETLSKIEKAKEKLNSIN